MKCFNRLRDLMFANEFNHILSTNKLDESFAHNEMKELFNYISSIKQSIFEGSLSEFLIHSWLIKEYYSNLGMETTGILESLIDSSKFSGFIKQPSVKLDLEAINKTRFSNMSKIEQIGESFGIPVFETYIDQNRALFTAYDIQEETPVNTSGAPGGYIETTKGAGKPPTKILKRKCGCAGKTCECNIKDKVISEAEYKGRSVPLNKPMRGDIKKSKVYVKDPTTGNVKKINFGDPNMRIKKNIPARRKSFRARHKCDTAKDKTTARYWSCKAW